MERWEGLLEDLREEFVMRERELLLREQELEFLHEVDLRILDSNEPLDTTIAFIVKKTQDLIGSSHSHVLLKRGPHLETVYSSNSDDIGQLIPIESSLTGQSLTRAEVVNIVDLSTPEYSSRYIPLKEYRGPAMRSLLAVPIKLDEGAIGVLNSESVDLGAFKQVHERVSSAIAGQIGIALQRAQLFDRAKLFAEVDQLIFADDRQEDVLQKALEKVLQALLRLKYVQLSGAQILFRRGEHQDLEVVHSTNPNDVGLIVSMSDSVCGRAVRERRTIILSDVSQDPNYKRMLGPEIQSEIAVPILIGDDKVVIGVLNIESSEPDAFGGFYQLILENFAEKVTAILAFAKLRTDVTEALELRHANDLLIAVGDQTSHMVHRLNNAVGAMRVRIKEIQQNCPEEVKSNEFLRESLESLLLSAEKTLEMPLEITRFLGRSHDIIQLNDCVTSALQEITIPDDIQVELRLGESIPVLELFSFDIVVQNLVRNAIDAMEQKGGGVLTIETALVAHGGVPGGYVQLSVKDTGVGIPDEIRADLFGINFTTKREKTGKGLGLGLWWVRNFIKRVEGEISIHSTVGVGSEVVVKLPVDLSEDNIIGSEVRADGTS
jgi:signal transduction histidine kinase